MGYPHLSYISGGDGYVWGISQSGPVSYTHLELAFALKFLSVADLAYGWGILDRETFLALWIVIFALLGLSLIHI